VLFAVVVAVTVLLLRRRKPAFWAPLTAGFIAAIVYWIVVVSYAIADHTMRYVA
jgi:hypothetical protein